MQSAITSFYISYVVFHVALFIFYTDQAKLFAQLRLLSMKTFQQPRGHNDQATKSISFIFGPACCVLTSPTQDTNRRHLLPCDPLTCHRLQYGHRKLSHAITLSNLQVTCATMETLRSLLLLLVFTPACRWIRTDSCSVIEMQISFSSSR